MRSTCAKGVAIHAAPTSQMIELRRLRSEDGASTAGKRAGPDASFESAAGAAVTVREDDESVFKSTLEI